MTVDKLDMTIANLVELSILVSIFILEVLEGGGKLSCSLWQGFVVGLDGFAHLAGAASL